MRTPILLLAVALSLSACGKAAPPMFPTRSVVAVENLVKISLRDIHDDILEFTVWNNSKEPMVIDRDAIVLDTDKGARKRLPGGVAHTYTLMPGAAREVNVRYDFSDLRNQLVRVRFDTAITIAGRPLDISPIEIRVQ